MMRLIERFPSLLRLGQVRYFPKKSPLLTEGEICRAVFLLETGSVRSWFNHDGNDITFQFFFAGDLATSFESLKNGLPALYNMETIDESRIRVIPQAALFEALARQPALQRAAEDYIADRLYHYQRLFISRIRHNPQQRYEELLAQQADIFDKVPHHYIATYLGITPVSLSRIRAKSKKADTDAIT